MATGTPDEWAKMFDAHDVFLQGRLPKAEVQYIVRSCGRMLLPSQMRQLLEKYGEPMTKGDFLDAMKTTVENEPLEKDLLPALQAFDTKETGVLTRQEIHQVFCQMGEKLSTAEVAQLFEGFRDDDKFPIDDTIKWLLKPAKKIKVSIKEVQEKIV